MKGILMIALGHENYSRMAANLAASIKVNDPLLQICVVTDKFMPAKTSHLFDQVKMIDKKMYIHRGKKEYIKSKLFMYELSPFKETIFLDVDQIVIKGRKLSTVFDELSSVHLSFSNTGKSDYSVWADIKEVQKIYGNQPFWNFHSEFVYFQKKNEVVNYFKVAQKAYAANNLQSAFKFAGGAMADELAFQIAAIQTDMYPHKENWLPNYWPLRHRSNNQIFPYQLDNTKITYSIGGAFVPSWVATNYNTLATYYFQKLGLQHAYQARDKRGFLPERQKI